MANLGEAAQFFFPAAGEAEHCCGARGHLMLEGAQFLETSAVVFPAR